eukprot:s2573_g10.t1
MPVVFWSRCTRPVSSAQYVHMKQLTWMACRRMLWRMWLNASVPCRLPFALSAMDSWFSAAPAAPERQVRPCTGRSSKDNDQLLTAVARLTLKTAQASRNLESAAFVTYILPKDSAYAQAATVAGQTYAQRARAAGKNHTLGQPSPWVWAAFAQAAMKDDALAEDKRALVKQHCDGASDPAELCNLVLHCRLSKVDDQSKVRLQIAVAPPLSDVLSILQEGVQNQNGERKHGPAPRGALERQIQELLGEPSGE